MSLHDLQMIRWPWHVGPGNEDKIVPCAIIKPNAQESVSTDESDPDLDMIVIDSGDEASVSTDSDVDVITVDSGEEAIEYEALQVHNYTLTM